MKKSEFILKATDRFPFIAKLGLRIWGYIYLVLKEQEHWLFYKVKENLRYRFNHRVYLLQKYPMLVDPFDSIGNAILKHGCYEKETVELCKHLLCPGMVVVDAGAHIGQYTILFSKMVTTTGKVYSFEPDPDSFIRLIKNIEINCAENVVANNLALSDIAGEGTLFILDSSRVPGGSSLRRQKSCNGSKVNIKITTMDEYARNIGLSKLDLLKVDIEGAELLLLKGAECVINNFRPLIIMELSEHLSLPFGYRKDDVYYKLVSFGYYIYEIAELPLKPYNINKEREDRPFFNVLCVPNSILDDFKKKGILNE
jgi:FkbM family methyltransferase